MEKSEETSPPADGASIPKPTNFVERESYPLPGGWESADTAKASHLEDTRHRWPFRAEPVEDSFDGPHTAKGLDILKLKDDGTLKDYYDGPLSEWQVEYLQQRGYCRKLHTDRWEKPVESPPTPREARPSWEDTFFALAHEWAKRATCPRRSVGCVIVDAEHAVVASGYNGAPRGMPHCDEVGCTMEGSHCVSAIHAEMNAVAFAARRGISLNGCVAYCTLLPCIQCMQLMLAAGIKEVHYDETYLRSERNQLFRLANLAGIKIVGRTKR